MSKKEQGDVVLANRWKITVITLIHFAIIAISINIAIHTKVKIDAEWKELLLLMLGAFIATYGKVIDYWFQDVNKHKKSSGE